MKLNYILLKILFDKLAGGLVINNLHEIITQVKIPALALARNFLVAAID